jgi:hypothetical protein
LSTILLKVHRNLQPFEKPLALANLVLQEPFLYLLRDLLHITPEDASSRAGLTASRLFIVLDSFMAEIALHCNFLVIIKLHGPKGTGLDTCLTADTLVLLYVDNASLIPEDGLYRACILTRGSGTMVAVDGDIGGRSLNHLYQPRPYTEVMLLLACHLAGMTTHAILLKYDQ